MKKITDSVLSLSNGFQSGETVIFLTQDSSGSWVEDSRAYTGEATWHDDEIVEDMKVSLNGRGIHFSFRGDSSFSRIKSVQGLFGFTAEELDGPAPEAGYECHDVAFNACDWREVDSLGDYLIAKFVHNFTPWGKDGVHSPPYRWGDQSADSFVLVKDGRVTDSVKGQGDTTPYLTESDAKCIADGKLYSSCKMQDEYEEHLEWEREAKRIGLWERYRNLHDVEDSESRKAAFAEIDRKVNEAIVRQYADERANQDSSGILKRLLNHYRKSMNPLKTLRKEFGGIWTFHRGCPEESPIGFVYHGDNWYVTHVPK